MDIPSTWESIAYNQFDGCLSLKSVAIGDNVLSVDSYAFRGCRNLITVTVGGGVKEIGEYAFEQCEAMKHLTRNI